MHLADVNTRDSVLLFAIKRAASFKVAEENLAHLVRWFLYAARRSATCLSFVVEHLSLEHAKGQQLPLIEIGEYIRRQIGASAESAHTNEVAWLLFWARELQISIDASTLNRVLNLRSGASALILFDLWQQNLINGRLDVSFWSSFANAQGLKSELWLVAYEVTKKGWWPKSRSSRYVESHEYFGELWARDVEFYSPARKARPQFKRPSFVQPIRASSDFHMGEVAAYP